MPSRGGQKDINELKRLVVSNGFKLVPNGSGHWKLLDKKGRVVVDADGPVILSGTASEVRARDMHVNRLLKAGALKSDPWKPDAPKTEKEKVDGKASHMHTEQARINRQNAEAKANAERREATQKLRGRIEPFMAAIGGWEKSGNQSELSRTAFHFLKSRGRVECWDTLSGCTQNAGMLKKGNQLSLKAVSAWDLFMDEIERSGDSMEERRARYFELVREAKGLGTTLSAPAPGPARDEVAVDEARRQSDLLKQRESGSEVEATMPNIVTVMNGSYQTPTLALRALAEMMMSVPDGTGLLPAADDRRQRSIDIATEILDMEIRTMTGRFVGVESVH